MGASTARFTDIVRAEVGVVARELAGADALAQVAVVAGSAHVSIVAGRVAERVSAAADGRAEVVRAHVRVVARQRPGERALARRAIVPGGARVVVVAGRHVGDVLAAVARLARIVGAGIAVVAEQRHAPAARAANTGFADCAVRTVVARMTVVGRSFITSARARIANRGQARGIHALCRRARDHRSLDNGASEGKLLLVAVQHAVAHVGVFKLPAVAVVLAFAVDGKAPASAFFATVRHCTRVVVVAVCFVESRGAPAEAVA